MTPRYILVHHVLNLTTCLVIFWVMSDGGPGGGGGVANGRKKSFKFQRLIISKGNFSKVRIANNVP